MDSCLLSVVLLDTKVILISYMRAKIGDVRQSKAILKTRSFDVNDPMAYLT